MKWIHSLPVIWLVSEHNGSVKWGLFGRFGSSRSEQDTHKLLAPLCPRYLFAHGIPGSAHWWWEITSASYATNDVKIVFSKFVPVSSKNRCLSMEMAFSSSSQQSTVAAKCLYMLPPSTRHSPRSPRIACLSRYLSSWVTKKREKLTIRTKISSTSVCWRVSKQPFLCYILYIEQWGFHWSMCQTIANGASDPRCPGQTCVMFKFRQLDDLFHTLKTVKVLLHLVPPQTPRSSAPGYQWCLMYMWSMLHVISVICLV